MFSKYYVMNFNFKTISPSILVCLLCIVIGGFCNINLLLPLIFVFLIIALKIKNFDFNISILDVGFLCVLVSEMFSFVFSAYQINSEPQLTNFYVIFIIYFFYKQLFRNERYYNTFVFLISSFSFFLAVITIIYFFNFKERFNSQGFFGLSEFKAFYMPFNKLNNIWASVIILLIPFNIVFLHRQRIRKYQILAFLNLCLLVFCVFASFSRGTYLSLMVFVLVFNIFSFRFLTIKKLMILDALCVVLFVLISLPIAKSTITTLEFNKTLSQRRSTEGRLERWENELSNNTWADRPYFGWGQKNYILAYSKRPYIKEDMKFAPLSYNIFHQILLEKGFVGIFCYLILFALIIVLFFRRLSTKSWGRFKKLQLIILFSGLLSFLVKELTFSSLFNSDSVYFLAFHLIFLLIPYDFCIKEFKISTKSKNSILMLLLIVTSFFSYSSVKRIFINKYNNEAVINYNRNNIINSLNSIDKALKLSPENIMLNKNRALILAKNCIDIDLSKDNLYFLSFVKINRDTLKLVKENLNNIIGISPYDDEIYQNIGWVHFALGEIDSAKIAFDEALLLNPYNSTYHLSKILYDIRYGGDIVDHLSKALRYSPEIVESFFYVEFSKKYPQEAKKAKMRAISGLRASLKIGNSIVLKARLARLILDEDPNESLLLLSEVGESIPNMSRPWLYKGLIYFKKGDMVQAYKNYETSLVMNNEDFLTRKYLSEYYKSINDNEEYMLNLDIALSQFQNLRSDNAVKYYYLSSFRPILNSYIPSKLLKFKKPYIDEINGLKLVKEYYQYE